ncbi:MAG TPA: septal ring lytic transglycosylase RlpA family protein [Candidatus Mucispirillum faecigallinarum]|uniref:Probable endolytic peptidoglycan transglycosylase RlpA n=1 Tax=Candidatus Mucispirillum faecigallinarum TaxID=2838699 RepID=A0A9D2GSL8_9BACT|nr:septal ring lytic transglycosylase RlpA family protein [Candidatus Mucispirillum faecigallinarum]
MRLLKLTIIFMFIFSSFSCAAQNEVQVKSYEDYFPAGNTKDENYDTYTYNDAENDDEVTAGGKAYSDDGYFQEAPVEIDAAVKSTGKCKAVSAPGPKKIGKPYKINGITYYPMESADGYSEVGVASWYGPGFHGKLTANGETYNQKAMTAAHKTLPLPTLVKVENLENGKSVVVRVNDRGPYSKGRIIDLTEVAARRLDMLDKGTAKVRVSVLSEDPDCYVTSGHEVNMDEGNFAVQIGAFTMEDNAKRLASKFGSRAVVSKGYAKGTEWSRVWITGYPTKEKALDAVNNELIEYNGAFVVRYK